MVVALGGALVGGVREQRDLTGVVYVVVDTAMQHRVYVVRATDHWLG